VHFSGGYCPANGCNRIENAWDGAPRKNDVQMVKGRIVVASKLGAPAIRVFSGRGAPHGA
jgi:hypothetical protein